MPGTVNPTKNGGLGSLHLQGKPTLIVLLDRLSIILLS